MHDRERSDAFASNPGCGPHHQLQQTTFERTVRVAQEPPKADLIAFAKDGTVPVRQAFCILQSPPSTLAIEALVDLSSGPKAAVTSWKTVRCPCSAGEVCHASLFCGSWTESRWVHSSKTVRMFMRLTKAQYTFRLTA